MSTYGEISWDDEVSAERIAKSESKVHHDLA